MSNYFGSQDLLENIDMTKRKRKEKAIQIFKPRPYISDLKQLEKLKTKPCTYFESEGLGFNKPFCCARDISLHLSRSLIVIVSF